MCAVFDAVKLLQNWAKSEGDRKSDPLSGTSHHNENHQTLQFSILLRLHTDLSKKHVMIMHFCFMLAFVFLTFSAKRCFRKPRPRKASALARQRPQITLQVFSKTFTISTLRPSSEKFKDFGIHQWLFEETSLKASILPRRSGRSPLQYAAAFSPEMPFKGAEGCGYTQTNFVWNLLFKGS